LKLKDKTAIVTGSSKGIGAGIAKELALMGCNVTVNYHGDKNGADKVKGYIEENTNQKAISVYADVSKLKDCKTLVEETLNVFGKIDILVNNAGIAFWKPFFEISEEIWDQTMNTNLKSVFMLSQLAGKNMAENNGGIIVNISSIASHGAMDCLVPYCASKGGMTLITKAMAVELAPYNIRVNAVSSGTIDIERNRNTDPDYPNDWIPYIPLGRVGKVEDIAKTVTFLCSEDSSYITGQNIFVCGGEVDYVPMPRSDFARKKNINE